MNTFMSSVFLLLASASAQSVFEPVFDSSAAAAASAMNEELGEVEAECYPDRPRPVRDGERNRFNLVRLNSLCLDEDAITYEWGQFDNIDGGDACAEACINSVEDSLYINTRGFEYDCDAQFCRCLYDEGTVTNTNEKVFDSSNYTTRSRKGQGSISGTEKTRSNESFACYKLVGAEFLEDVAQMSRLRGHN